MARVKRVCERCGVNSHGTSYGTLKVDGKILCRKCRRELWENQK